ncbi:MULTISPECIES: Lrp/AsnC family transcriptional regulator [Microbacterium]|uniref:Lrp/AsnC family transcriptional regulator n=1 Tax=Microbacterium TaxID=33882 RepID=UPI000D654A67|nr:MULTISPECIES: Lrp/AsnC family transcriptional regulator [Microbacterium]
MDGLTRKGDSGRPSSNDLRNSGLDEVDAELLRRLSADARITNQELAAAAGVAPSTAHTRVRALIERGVLAGFHAAVSQSSIGNGLQAMIGVTLRPGFRQESITQFADVVRALPQVLQLFFVGGADDYLVHIAVADSSELRRFVVEHLSAHQAVASTRTSIIFEYHRNGVAAEFA